MWYQIVIINGIIQHRYAPGMDFIPLTLAEAFALAETSAERFSITDKVNHAIALYKKECLPHAEEAFHFQAEQSAGFDKFVEWLRVQEGVAYTKALSSET